MTELESAADLLSDDPAGSGLGRIREELLAMRTTVRRAMDAGMTPDAMAAARRVLDAVDAGDRVAGQLHGIYNR